MILSSLLSARITLIQSGLSLAVLVLLFLVFRYIPLGTVGAIDFLQYWSSARLLLMGQNPYDPQLLKELQTQALPLEGLPILLWNPPTIFTFTVMLGFIPFKSAVSLWMLGLVVSFFATLALLLSVFRIGRPTRPILVFLLSFYPFFEVLGLGQSSHIHLLGLALFLYLAIMNSESITSNFWAGAALSLSLIKPHLLLLLYLALIIWSIRRKELSTLVGLAVGGVVLLLPALVIQPNIIDFYLTAASTPPIYWQTPTLGSWLQGRLGLDNHFERFLPTLIVVPTLVMSLMLLPDRGRLSDRLIFGLIPLSLFTSAYGWIFDQVLLLPSFLWWYSQRGSYRGWKLYLPCLCNLVLLITPKNIGQHTAVWYPAAVLILFALEIFRTEREKVELTAS